MALIILVMAKYGVPCRRPDAGEMAMKRTGKGFEMASTMDLNGARPCHRNSNNHDVCM